MIWHVALSLAWNKGSMKAVTWSQCPTITWPACSKESVSPKENVNSCSLNEWMNEMAQGAQLIIFSVWNWLLFFSSPRDPSLLEPNGVIKQRRKFGPYMAVLILSVPFPKSGLGSPGFWEVIPPPYPASNHRDSPLLSWVIYPTPSSQMPALTGPKEHHLPGGVYPPGDITVLQGSILL